MKTSTMLIVTAALLANAIAGSVAAADEATLVQTDTAVLGRIAAQAKGEAAMTRDLGVRADRVAPVIAQEEVFDVERLSQAQVQNVVGEHAEEVQSCYERFAARVRTATGEVALKFVVEPMGRVSSVSVAAPGVGGKQLSKCIVQRVKKWRFPAADAETEVEIPFVFAEAGTALD